MNQEQLKIFVSAGKILARVSTSPNPGKTRTLQKEGRLIYEPSNLQGAVSELIAVLSSLALLLREIGEDRWGAWIEESNRLLQNDDLYGVDHLLQAYGGMGSLNDVIVPQTQTAIRTLPTRAWELGKFIQRNSN